MEIDCSSQNCQLEVTKAEMSIVTTKRVKLYFLSICLDYGEII